MDPLVDLGAAVSSESASINSHARASVAPVLVCPGAPALAAPVLESPGAPALAAPASRGLLVEVGVSASLMPAYKRKATSPPASRGLLVEVGVSASPGLAYKRKATARMDCSSDGRGQVIRKEALGTEG